MANGHKVQIDLVKLTSGDRLMRLTDTDTGLTLERKLDPQQPLVRQKKILLGIFEAALTQATAAAH